MATESLRETGAAKARVAMVATAAASVACGVALAALDPSLEAALLVAIALVLAVPVAVRVLQRRADVFEPIVVASLALFVMYVGRPAVIVADDRPKVFKGYDVTDRIGEALLIALVAVAALQIGYALPAGRALAARLRPAPGRWAVDMTVGYSLGLIAVAIMLFSLFLMQGGGLYLLPEFLKGRNAAHEGLFRSSSAYLYGAPALIWPASLLLFAAGIAARRRVVVALSFAGMATLGVFAGGSGSRITLIPLVLAPAVYWYLSRGRRPGALAVLIASYLVFTVGIAYFRDTRTAGTGIDRIAELEKAVSDPSYEARELLQRGTDNDMFESLATETVVVPERLAANPVDYVYRLVVKPIPSALWASKPVSADERLNDTLFPGETVRASSSTGIVGSFYLAGELPGVLLGMMLVGVLLRAVWEYWRRYPRTSVAQLAVTVTIMFVPVLLRGGLSDTIAYVLFTFAPFYLGVRLCRVPAETEAAA